jgi:hypothetical protein
VASTAADEEEGTGGERDRPRGLKKRGVVAAAVSEISGGRRKNTRIFTIEPYSPGLITNRD